MPSASETVLSAAKHVVMLPSITAIASHATRFLIAGTLVPLGLFYGMFSTVGLRAALAAALAWSLGLIAHRAWRGRRIEATLMLSAALMTVRTAVAWMTGSAFVYFLQPTLSTFVTAFALLGSVAFRKPFTERAVRDFVPLPPALLALHAIQRFFTRASVLWGCMYLVNGSVTLWLLLTRPIGEFMVLSKAGGLVLTSLTLCVSGAVLMWTVRHEHITFKWASRRARSHPAAGVDAVATPSIPVTSAAPVVVADPAT